jgi:hypothetical protein
MKKFMLLMSLALSASAFAYDYTVTSGYFGDMTLRNNQSLLMTGGGGDSLTGKDYSTLDIRNTSPLVVLSGGIWGLTIADHSQLKFSGGHVDILDIGDYATATIGGGQINELRGFYSYADLQHIKIICDTYNYNTTTKILTGTWLDNSAFNIQLIDTAGYTSTWNNITIIPEPATMLLLAVGGLLLKCRK